MNSLLRQYVNFNSSIEINFEGSELTSDAGLLLYKDFDEKLVSVISSTPIRSPDFQVYCL